MKRKHIWASILGLTIIMCAGLTIRIITIPEWRTWIKVVDFDPFTLPEAIEYPHAKEIKRGTARSEVKRLLGEPQWRTNFPQTVRDPYGYTHESCPEFWEYHWTGWSSAVKIAFDKQGNVTHCTWGHG